MAGNNDNQFFSLLNSNGQGSLSGNLTSLGSSALEAAAAGAGAVYDALTSYASAGGAQPAQDWVPLEGDGHPVSSTAAVGPTSSPATVRLPARTASVPFSPPSWASPRPAAAPAHPRSPLGPALFTSAASSPAPSTPAAQRAAAPALAPAAAAAPSSSAAAVPAVAAAAAGASSTNGADDTDDLFAGLEVDPEVPPFPLPRTAPPRSPPRPQCAHLPPAAAVPVALPLSPAHLPHQPLQQPPQQQPPLPVRTGPAYPATQPPALPSPPAPRQLLPTAQSSSALPLGDLLGEDLFSGLTAVAAGPAAGPPPPAQAVQLPPPPPPLPLPLPQQQQRQPVLQQQPQPQPELDDLLGGVALGAAWAGGSLSAQVSRHVGAVPAAALQQQQRQQSVDLLGDLEELLAGPPVAVTVPVAGSGAVTSVPSLDVVCALPEGDKQAAVAAEAGGLVAGGAVADRE
ncbi:hypothetical protein Agub_g3835, partial [Astrephomene gubernaculifera]